MDPEQRAPSRQDWQLAPDTATYGAAKRLAGGVLREGRGARGVRDSPWTVGPRSESVLLRYSPCHRGLLGRGAGRAESEAVGGGLVSRARPQSLA